MTDLDALERLAKTYSRPVDRMEMRPEDVILLIGRVRNADLRGERDEARIALLESTLRGAISDLAGHDCQNVREFEAVLSESKAGKNAVVSNSGLWRPATC